MIIDKKGKLFGKISIIDLLVVLIIIVGVLGTLFTFSTLNSGKLNDNSKLALVSGSSMQECVVSFKINGVRAVTRDSLAVGDAVYETEDGLLIGTIEEITFEDAEKAYIGNDGEIYYAKVPECYDVIFKVLVNGKNTETGFHTESGVQLLYGKEIEIKTPSVKTKPEIVSLEINTTGE